MRKNAWTITIFTGIMGAFALFLRWLQTQNLYDEGGTLVRRGSPYNTAVICIIVAAVAAIALMTLRQRKRLAELAPDKALRRESHAFPILASAACILLFAGAVWLLLSGTGYDFVVGALFIVSAPALAAPMMKRNGNSGKKLAAFCSVLPVIAFGFWLFAEYKLSSANPQLWQFAPRILAISFSTLGFYYIAGFSFGQPRPAATVFFALSAAFFCMMTATDDGGMAKGLIFAALALLQLLLSWSILANPHNTGSGQIELI